MQRWEHQDSCSSFSMLSGWIDSLLLLQDVGSTIVSVQFKSHYETLQVLRSAPHEVIRAAHHALVCARPLEPNSSEAEARELALINSAWEVLGNPDSRAAYDKWLSAKEASPTTFALTLPSARPVITTYTQGFNQNRNRAPRSIAVPSTVSNRSHTSPQDAALKESLANPGAATTSDRRQSGSVTRIAVRIAALPILIAIAWFFGVAASALLSKQPSDTRNEEANVGEAVSDPNRAVQPHGIDAPTQAHQALQNSTGREPSLGPARSVSSNSFGLDDFLQKPGKQAINPRSDPDFREKSGPLGKQLAVSGLSTFTVDNTRGNGDVVVRLYPNGELPAVRSIVVKGGDSYTAKRISTGEYAMRYRRVGSDDTFEADRRFYFEEKETANGIQYSTITVTMFNVQNGNLSHRRVSNSLF